ncbi:MAG: DegT/DnrJ/EryC1/StrS family aminotransferase [Candidatus Aenigmarchaeota archaeon]|nr:DegT/DnrJ/EryC1/StrS family aminotransferase [Candidatus Aenigmarchaeota archaeon]
MIKISDPIIEKEEIEAAARALASGILARGPETKNFEDGFARFAGAQHAIATSNGTTALHAALLANGITSGEVLTPSFSFAASANCILHAGAKPIFADVRYDDFCVDTSNLENKITENTKAIIAVHLYGQMCDMDTLTKICKQNNLILIEDACQAHGAEFNGKRAGSFGTGCFSLYATKNMTTGEGGMITTSDPAVAENSRKFINHGSLVAYDNKELGFNFRMTEMQAAIGNEQLKKIEHFNSARISNARMLSEMLEGTAGIELPIMMPGRKHVFHQFTIKVSGGKREAVINELQKNSIGYGIYYPKPIHEQDLYLKLGYRDKLPVSERLARESLSLPIHPRVSTPDLEKIAACVRKAVS